MWIRLLYVLRLGIQFVYRLRYSFLRFWKLNSLKMVEFDKDTSLEEMETTREGELTSKEKQRQALCNDLLDHLSLNQVAHFKSQQIGEPDLSREQKRDIAESVLNRSYSLFLSRFGTHLLEKHLDYFVECSIEERYEVEFYLNKLRKNHCRPVSKVCTLIWSILKAVSYTHLFTFFNM